MTTPRTENGKTSRAGSRQVRLIGLTGAVVALLAAGCQGSGGEQAAPSTTSPITASPGTPAPTPPGEPVRADERRPLRVSFLQRAETCERFAQAVKAVAIEAVDPYGFAGGASAMVTTDGAAGRLTRESAAAGAAPAAAPAAPKAGVDFSGTNVQEAGVDEPDAVKTDGRLLVAMAGGRLQVLDVTGAPRLVGGVDLSAGNGNLLLVGNRVLVLSDQWETGGVPGTVRSPRPDRRSTAVTVVDLAEPARPKVVRTHTIDGSYVDARLIGGVVRLVTRSSPDISFPQPVPDDQARPEQRKAANADIVRKAPPAAFLPQGASCADAYVPAEASGVGAVAVRSIDPAADAPGPAVTVVADASTVYASANRLFVATSPSAGRVVPASRAAVAPTEPARTAIHAFDITDPAKARYAGSGDVPGSLLNQFSLSEDAGVLRVATTLDAPFVGGPNDPATSGQGGSSQSRVTILRPAGEEWVETGAVEGLGKGERIYAVRFIGTTGYVVTFRQVDPLYVLDLRDVRAPKVTGELKITGYSAYLHPAGEGRLLGIGQEASEQGRRMGTQLSLFDVGNPAAPTKLAGAVLPSSSSSAENDHHAFLFWPTTGLVVAPVTSYGEVRGPMPTEGPTQPSQPTKPTKPAPPFVGAVAFKVGDTSVTEAGRITHPDATPIDRSLVVGDRLLTVSRAGVAANDLTTLAGDGFVAFRR